MAAEHGWAVKSSRTSASGGVSSEMLLEDHQEKHFTASDVVRDVIIGVSDGLTVPFALAAGLSGANVPSYIILTAGLAEVAAGAISMGLGGYLAAKSEADHYMRELKREQEEIIAVPDNEAAEIAEILAKYGLEPHEYGPVVNSLRKNPQAWLEFMMKFELGLEKPDPKRASQSALTIAVSYMVGGAVPLLPYVFIPTATKAMFASIGVTLAALLFFGYVKGRFTGDRPLLSAIQTAFIGAVASAAAYAMAKAVQAS
ncbi:vacuolar iron transporter 2-like [Zingiber officinale]|uniref:vacuolar iron transporter 2-like n=1 Tax=Zingiber officinale TaxID=94328 RepID=UPI001C4B2202|nr:vacuolar iron transporter 2-like [Zingiber officinale]